MGIKLFRSTFIFIVASFIITQAYAQVIHEPVHDSSWEKPYPPFRIAGNLYYVGTYDLACYLVTTSQGNILVNTGLASSAGQIKKNIETLGFNFKNTKILLLTQAHYDHAGALFKIKKETGAKLIVDSADAGVLETGGLSDYEFGKYGATFKPVKPDHLLQNGDTIRLGEMNLVLLHHPGHTKGSCSFLFTVHDSANTYRVLIANMPTIIVDRPFAEVTAYPTIAQDYAYTLHAMKQIDFDIWLASHASQFQLHKKHQPGDAYNPSAFFDRRGYDEELNSLQQQFEDKLKKDASKQ